ARRDTCRAPRRNAPGRARASPCRTHSDARAGSDRSASYRPRARLSPARLSLVRCLPYPRLPLFQSAPESAATLLQCERFVLMRRLAGANGAIGARAHIEGALEHAAEMRRALEADAIGDLADGDVTRLGRSDPARRHFEPLIPDQSRERRAMQL